MAIILAISSHVARGSVGLAATVPALQWLGHEVWALPTVLLASRPGLGQLVRHELPAADLAAMLSALEADGCWPKLSAVLTGYFPSAASVRAAAAAVGRIRAARPEIPVLVDPIVGDAGRLYVAEATAAAIRDELLPLATTATPNLFELAWLAGASASGPSEPLELVRRLGLKSVLVTSAGTSRRDDASHVATLAVTAGEVIERVLIERPGIPNGAGDLLAGLYLGHLLNEGDAVAALDASLADLDRVLAASEGRDVLQLAALDLPGRPLP